MFPDKTSAWGEVKVMDLTAGEIDWKDKEANEEAAQDYLRLYI
ncbi:hypothetical protein DCCM_2132 [Desulfocucumis palustris]|uniref:Uncharacterized protein n=1 Tax=Desulfocucumis palustris TaxID=1898651 RepID=A0A2L2XA09_9FIRM|nr:hypothetical protein [Desulfocucumis palustris]GBF33035.1 hypothetical protein DCCM_2132 [Desulfocucumis palustris]